MIIKEMGETTVIYTIWRGVGLPPENTSKITITPPTGQIGNVTGIKVEGYNSFFMNVRAAEQLLNALEKAIEIANENN